MKMWFIACVLIAFSAVMCGCSNAKPQAAERTEPTVASSSESPERRFVGMTYWDLDADNDKDRPTADLLWQHMDEHERYLVPRNGAAVTIVHGRSFDSLTEQDLRGLSYSKDRLSGSDVGGAFDVGSVLAVRTNEGRYAKLLIAGFEPYTATRRMDKYDMRVKYVVY